METIQFLHSLFQEIYLAQAIFWTPHYQFSVLLQIFHVKIYVGVSKSSQTSSTDRERMALRECVRCA